MSSQGSITCWIEQLKAGDVDAAQKLWEGYYQRMVALARRRLQGAARCMADEEDVALSAFNSFCEGAQHGRFPQLSDRHDLWPLLVSITAHKSVDLIRRENRQKRGGTGQGGNEANRLLRTEIDFDQLVGTSPTPEFAMQIAEELDRLLHRLDATGDKELRTTALWKMEGMTTPEIAIRLGCVRRTVERKLELIARLWAVECES